MQAVVEQKQQRIICTAFTCGRQHDFALFQNSRLPWPSDLPVMADRGYQGLQKQHAGAALPVKKPRGGELNPQQRRDNRALNRQRIGIERVFAHLKCFRILSGRYRNRRKRFGLRFNLIAALHNAHLPPLFNAGL